MRKMTKQEVINKLVEYRNNVIEIGVEIIKEGLNNDWTRNKIKQRNK